MGRNTCEHGQGNKRSRNGEEQEQASVSPNHVAAARIVVLNGEVNENTISSVIVQMIYLANQDSAPIHLVISTYGGSVDEMFGLYDTIKFITCPVHTVALGKVMSAGVLLLAAGEKGSRLIGRNARIMVHPTWAATSGNVFEQLNSAHEHKRQHDQLVDALSRETKMSKARVNQMMKLGHDSYLTAAEAIELGIVDKYVDA